MNTDTQNKMQEIPSADAVAAYNEVVNAEASLAGLVLADAVAALDGGALATVTNAAGVAVAVNVIPGQGDAVIKVAAPDGFLSYEVITVHPAMNRGTAQRWANLTSLAEVRKALLTIAHG